LKNTKVDEDKDDVNIPDDIALQGAHIALQKMAAMSSVCYGSEMR
jgi:hypothetical protein